jgi:hypothetical protein
MSSMLPPLYAAWMEQVLPGPIPAETRATCQQCAMCPPATGAAPSTPSTVFFHPQTKCCTYLPRLPNFLVGRILADDAPEMQPGRASVEQRIRNGIAVTPLGLAANAHFKLVYQTGNGATFGTSLALRCPHYLEEGGLCGIWRHREATCVTWFCKHARGAVGQRFWHTLKLLLASIEESLARWCVQQLEVGSESLRLLFIPPPSPGGHQMLDSFDLDGQVNPEHYRAIWGAWAGREHDFYRASAALVEALTWDEISALCGPELPILIRLTQEAYQALVSEIIPPILQMRPLQQIVLERGSCRLVSYSRYDPLRLPAALISVLPAFDGRPVEQALESIAKEAQITLDQGLIRKLADFEVLALPPPAEEGEQR